ncbi:Fasciclin-domain-containing protein [Gyrodon lividus]|nr:Fasciclin-domain-containing protein [Gyrodon lividus]
MQILPFLFAALAACNVYAQSSATLDALLSLLSADPELALFVQLVEAIPASDTEEVASLLTSNVTILIPESAPNGTVSQLLGNPSLILPLISYHLLKAPVDNSSIATSPNHTLIQTALTDSSTVFLENNQSQSIVLTTKSDGSIHILNQPTDVTVTPRASLNVLDVTYAWANISNILTVPGSISTTLPTTNNTVFTVEASVAGVLNTYESQHGITLFVPQDSAFVSVNGTISGLNSTELASVINGHVLNGTFYSTQLTGTQASLAGKPLSLSGSNVALQGGNSAKIVTSDVPLSNGVAHIVDTVLLLDNVKSGGATSLYVSVMNLAAPCLAFIAGAALAV